MTTEKTGFCRRLCTIIEATFALSSFFRIYNRLSTTKIIPTLFLTLLFSMISCTDHKPVIEINEINKTSEDTIATDKTVERVHQTIYGIDVDTLYHEKITVKRGENLSDILSRCDLDRKTISKCESAISKVFDLRKVRAGNKYCLITCQDSAHTLRHFIYEISSVEYFVLSINEENITATKNKHKVVEKERVAEGVIETSLWNAVVGQGLQWELAMKLSDIYAWNIDFFGLQKGDMFKAKYTERWVDTTFVGIDSIKCAMFYHDNREYHAIPFDIDGKTNILTMTVTVFVRHSLKRL